MFGRSKTPRPSSTKTRIKTVDGKDCPQITTLAPRPSSTKTRIKTKLLVKCKFNIRSLRDHLPLKQGLRRVNFDFCASCRRRLRDHLPLKQGLRLIINGETLYLLRYAPRPSSTKTRIKTSGIGLSVITLKDSPRPSSTKTRIKTI